MRLPLLCVLIACLTSAAAQTPPAPQPGIPLDIYQLAGQPTYFPQLFPGQTPNDHLLLAYLSLDNNSTIFGAYPGAMIAQASCLLRIVNEDTYRFRFTADDGLRVWIDDRLVVEIDTLLPVDLRGSLGVRRDVELTLSASDHPLRLEYFNAGGSRELRFEWYIAGIRSYAPVPAELFYHLPADEPVLSTGVKQYYAANARAIPGDGQPVAGMHPMLRTEDLLPDAYRHTIGGLAWLPGGRLAYCTWDSLGAVYVLQDGQPRRIAGGLHEPLGLQAVGDTLYVLQKQELTRLVDLDGDGTTDSYETVCQAWEYGGTAYEFAGGLHYDGEAFYLGLSQAMDAAGKPLPRQGRHRGTLLRVDRQGGADVLATGLYFPNSLTPDGRGGYYLGDAAQGDQPARLLHVRRGGTAQALAALPPVRVPGQGWIPGQGPYAGQLLLSDLVGGGLKRVAWDSLSTGVNVALFRCAQGFDAGLHRLLPTEDGRCIAGGASLGTRFAELGKYSGTLQRLSLRDSLPFELSRVTATRGGLVLHFTEELPRRVGPGDFEVRQGGAVLPVGDLRRAPDGRALWLALDGLAAGQQLHLRLVHPLVSAAGHALWSTEAWYALNHAPDRAAPDWPVVPVAADNNLLPEEVAAGWQSLFDGQTTRGWRNYRAQTVSPGWQVVEGTLARVGQGAGDLVSEGQYGDFELEFEWQIAEGGNSGVFYLVVEDERYPTVWRTGPEYQLLDDLRHPDNKLPSHRSGSNYDLQPPAFEALGLPGTWNRSRIRIRQGEVEHWLNGYPVVRYTLWTPAWEAQVAASKFRDMPAYGRARRGHIALQDHGDPIRFRNIRIRELDKR
ncbi:MAG: hypothetical protein OHK0039_37930 [Bacteroidia bacterium]